MFYYASKILWFFATPSNLLILLILAGRPAGADPSFSPGRYQPACWSFGAR